MTSPEVTVVMPIFNSGRHIAKAIESVMGQTFADFELCVVDGGSTDGSCEIVEGFLRSDPRVRLIHNPRDNGPAHARSIAIENSRGDFVAFLDADDYWLTEKLNEQIAFMKSQRAVFSYTYYRPVSDDGARIGCVVPMRASYNFRQALSRRGIGTLTVMVRRELLTRDVVSVWKRAGGEEYLWWLLILRKGIVAKLLPRDLARYRDTAGSLSKNQLYTLRSVWRMYRRDLGLSAARSLSCYVPYLFDAAARKTWVRLRSRFPRHAESGLVT